MQPFYLKHLQPQSNTPLPESLSAHGFKLLVLIPPHPITHLSAPQVCPPNSLSASDPLITPSQHTSPGCSPCKRWGLYSRQKPPPPPPPHPRSDSPNYPPPLTPDWRARRIGRAGGASWVVGVIKKENQ